MLHRLGTLAAACLLALVLALAGCGDDEDVEPRSSSAAEKDERPSRDRQSREEKAQDAFIDSLDRACRPYEKAYDALVPRFERTAKSFDVEPAEGNQLSPEGVEVLANLIDERLVPHVAGVRRSLEDVPLPIKNRRAAERFLRALDESLETLVRDPKTFFLFDLRSQAFGETDVLAQDLELASCRVGYDLYAPVPDER